MTRLALEIQRILESERDYPPMSADSLVNVLRAIGYPHGPAGLPEVEKALEELLAGGQLERVHSARLGARYRVSHNVQSGDLDILTVW